MQRQAEWHFPRVWVSLEFGVFCHYTIYGRNYDTISSVRLLQLMKKFIGTELQNSDKNRWMEPRTNEGLINRAIANAMHSIENKEQQ